MEPMSPDEVDRFAQRAGLALSPEELRAFSTAVAGIMTGLPGPEELLDAVPAMSERRVRDSRPPSSADDPMNAVVHWCHVAPTGTGLLEGKRISVKDSIAVAGIPMTGGFKALTAFRPVTDSVVVDRVLAAGAEIVAMTNMDCLGWAASGETSGHGPTRNPHDPRRTAGGSSSGAAAGLSYPGIDMAIGCDQGGSIRIPASWCGVIGLKPTHGLVPYTGILGIDAGIDHVGPLATNVADLAALLQVMAGPDDHDPRQRNVVVRDYMGALHGRPDLRGVRVGLLREGFADEAGVDEATRHAVLETAGKLEALGASTQWVSVPVHHHVGGVGFIGYLEGMASLFRSGGQGHGVPGRHAPDLAMAFGEALAAHPEQLSPQAKAALIIGEYLTQCHHGALYGAARNRMTEIRGAYDDAMEGVDVLLMPTAPYPAPEISTDTSVESVMARGWSMLTNTTPFNLTGHPAVSLPLSVADGLPVGTMLVGRHFAEDLLIEIASVCESTLGWTPLPATVTKAEVPS